MGNRHPAADGHVGRIPPTGIPLAVAPPDVISGHHRLPCRLVAARRHSTAYRHRHPR